MKIHHLIHALMVLINEHPEAKDFNLTIHDPHGVYVEREPRPHIVGKEIRL